MLSRAIDFYAPSSVKNLGDGAYISGTESIKHKDLSLKPIDKVALKREMTSNFSNKREDIFVDIREDFYLDLVLSYKGEIFDLLDREIGSKRELFCMIDELTSFCADMCAKNRFVGILFEGSISHILHCLMLCSLHIKSDDIKDFYRESASHIKSGINKMVMQYRILSNS